MKRFRVFYNTHKYDDCSDPPRPASRIVRAESADEAYEVVRRMRTVGRYNIRYIGMIHSMEEVVK